jgi:hypothetical protein
MFDAIWTPGDALRIRTNAFDACIAGKTTATHLHIWLVNTYAAPLGAFSEEEMAELSKCSDRTLHHLLDVGFLHAGDSAGRHSDEAHIDEGSAGRHGRG